MKFVVTGGSGFIGSKVLKKLRQHGEEEVATSANSGVETLTSEDSAEAADRDQEPGRLDAVAGSEFLDDRIRLRD